MAGNVGLLKHASNVQGAAKELERLFIEAGFPEGVFQNLIVQTEHIEGIIRDPRVVAVTLTGSERAGIAVATTAGSELKKVVLELGGSDPFIVLKDADLEKAATVGALSRLQNTGQSCIAAKRFIVEKSVAEKFTALFKEKFEQISIGDPMDEKTQMGPLVSERSLSEIEKQVARSVEAGAKVVTGGKRHGTKGFFYTPTILANVAKGMPAYDEEIFGPVASVIEVADAEEAIRVANDTRFGLGANIWTKDTELAKKMAARIESGFVAINGMVKSDQRLPFGGVKKSGFGRELSRYGILEFVNVKTVTIA
jgi:succinate-semialdehyde dehydrogenase/glutarate-semialdehyde dehydrogenase